MTTLRPTGFVLVFVAAVSATRPAAAAAVDEAPDAAAAVPGLAEPVPAAEDQAANAEVKLTLVPSNFNLNRSIQFDENGEPRHRNNQMSLSFRCLYETEAVPLAYRDLEITSVVTSAGEELEINPDHQGRGAQNIRADRQFKGRPYFDLYLNLPAPTRPAESLRELRGTLKMDLSRGPERVLRLSPVSKYVDKRFRVTDMDDAPMSMQRVEAQNNQPAMIEWTFSRTIEPLIQEVKFYRRNGVEFEVNQWGGGGNNTTRSMRYTLDAPDDAIMVVRLFRETRTVEVPFVARDMALPNPEPEGRRFDLAIATEPAGHGGAPPILDEPGDAPAGEDAVGENDLPIIILD